MVANSVIVTIIICTHNRAAMLEGTLDSVSADTSVVPREVIIVDNASTDSTRLVVERFTAQCTRIAVHYLFESKLGLSHARNRGVAAAAGSVLLFTDDDVLVDNGWADAMLTAFSDPQTGAVGGRVLPIWPSEPPAWILGSHAEHLTLRDLGTKRLVIDMRPGDASNLPVGANLGVRADVAKRLTPPFDPTLGSFGRLKIDSDEVRFLRQVAETHLVGYEPTAVVRHRILAARMDRAWLRRCSFQRGVGNGRWNRLEGDERPALPVRVGQAVRSLLLAQAIRIRNDRLSPLPATRVAQEVNEFAAAGKRLEGVLGRFPRLANWVAARIL